MSIGIQGVEQPDSHTFTGNALGTHTHASDSATESFVTSVAAGTLRIQHDANAATNGTPLYAYCDQTHPYVGHFYSASANLADAVIQSSTGLMAAAQIVKYAASPPGFLVFKNSTTHLLQCNNTLTGSPLMMGFDTGMYYIAHSATAAADGTQIYFDDNAADIKLRFLTVDGGATNRNIANTAGYQVSNYFYTNFSQGATTTTAVSAGTPSGTIT